jgi:hypothetical protein
VVQNLKQEIRMGFGTRYVTGSHDQIHERREAHRLEHRVGARATVGRHGHLALDPPTPENVAPSGLEFQFVEKRSVAEAGCVLQDLWPALAWKEVLDDLPCRERVEQLYCFPLVLLHPR